MMEEYIYMNKFKYFRSTKAKKQCILQILASKTK